MSENNAFHWWSEPNVSMQSNAIKFMTECLINSYEIIASDARHRQRSNKMNKYLYCNHRIELSLPPSPPSPSLPYVRVLSRQRSVSGQIMSEMVVNWCDNCRWICDSYVSFRLIDTHFDTLTEYLYESQQSIEWQVYWWTNYLLKTFQRYGVNDKSDSPFSRPN